MSAVDRFMAGEDRLSAVLKAMPFYDAPDSLAASVQAAAAQTEREAWNVANAPAFEPSAALADAVLREAQRMEAAQTVRREALWNTLEHATPAEALGTSVTAATEAWLRQQQAKRDAAWAQKPIRKSQRRWWTLPRIAFGFSCGLALFFGFAMQRVEMTPAPQTHEAEIAAMASEAAEIAEAEPPTAAAPPPPMQIAAAPSTRGKNRAFAVEEVMQEAAPVVDKLAKPRADELAQIAPLASAAPVAAAEPSELADARAVGAEPEVTAPAAQRSVEAKIAAASRSAELGTPPPSPIVMAKRDAARSATRVYTYLIHGAEWQQLANSWAAARQQERSRAKAAITDAAASAEATAIWYLEAADIETEDIRALVALLHASLPSGTALVVRPQADVPSGYARLLR